LKKRYRKFISGKYFCVLMDLLRCSPSNRTAKDYPVIIGTNIIEEKLPNLIKSYNPDKIIIITDSNVEKLYGEKVISILNPTIPTQLVSMPAGENNKKIETYIDLYRKVISKEVSKKSFILLLGGGVPGNTGGFVASTVMRGLKFAHIPTTIISQADSTTGGKQGINTTLGKNLLGLFNDPEFVLVDTSFLKTLPKREIKCGLAECIKHALCQDKEFVNYLSSVLNKESEYTDEELQKIIYLTLAKKLEVLRYDPKEINEGKVLVYGHTIGHAIETLGNYKLTHGEAISIGMMFVAFASKELGIASDSLIESHRNLLVKAGLPIKFPEYITEDLLVQQLKFDKKYTTGMELILLEDIALLQSKEGRIGHPTNEEFIRKVYQKYFS
jgi:3-dehydroquinate synthase